MICCGSESVGSKLEKAYREVKLNSTIDQQIDRAQLEECLSGHLSAVGVRHELFAETAMDEICRVSRRTTQLVNKLRYCR